MRADPVREQALAVLERVEAGGSLDRAFDRALSVHGDPRRQRFLAELVKGTLVWRGRYDRVIEVFSRRRPPEQKRLRQILRLGLHQLLAQGGVPAHAALSETVELTRAAVGERPAAYVNGLLRAVHRAVEAAGGNMEAALRPLFPGDPESVEHLSGWYSFPPWLVARWHARLGPRETERLLEVLDRPPVTTLHVLPPADPRQRAEDLAAAGHATVAHPLHPRALVLAGRQPRRELADLLDRFPDLIVQDAAAQAAAAYLLADTRGPAADLCAAPGGKSFHWAAREPGARPLVALDRSGARLRLMAGTALRLPVAPTALVRGDAAHPPLAPGRWRAVLLDGPCSGTGVLRRHAEGRWRLTPAVITASGERLLELAIAAAALVAPGGLLLYATCSLEPEENEQVIAALRRERPDLVPEAPPARDAAGPSGPDAAAVEVADFPGDSAGTRRWWPQRHEADGFYAARLRRR
ncbi:MAG: transcription antitermination factor NusB [Candidatus Krumholzibacteriia bacterium]